MKCQFCGNHAGFLKTYHTGCKEKVERHLVEMESIINGYNQEKIDHWSAQRKLVELATSNTLYQNYLWNMVFIRSNIRTNEVLIYAESQISIAEKKNWKIMERTGLSYARYPTWNVESRKIAEMATVAFTDKAIYLLGVGKTYVYPYSKIVNIGFERGWNDEAYFDVKTTSPHPHRYSLWPTDGKSKGKSHNIALFLYCLCNWGER